MWWRVCGSDEKEGNLRMRALSSERKRKEKKGNMCWAERSTPPSSIEISEALARFNTLHLNYRKGRHFSTMSQADYLQYLSLVSGIRECPDQFRGLCGVRGTWTRPQQIGVFSPLG
jgi:hypothetical protein